MFGTIPLRGNVNVNVNGAALLSESRSAQLPVTREASVGAMAWTRIILSRRPERTIFCADHFMFRATCLPYVKLLRDPGL